MNIALWFFQFLFALMFFFAGAMKLFRSKEQMLAMGGDRMAWVEDFSNGQLRAIGLAEVLGALGLVLPGLFGILPVLTPWSAVGLAIIMVGAAVTHLRRDGEGATAAVNIVIALLLAFVAYGRFALFPL